MRDVEIWHIWKQDHLEDLPETFDKSIFHVGVMQLQGNGLYTALLIKVFAYLKAGNPQRSHDETITGQARTRSGSASVCAFFTPAHSRAAPPPA
jgi:hypothetical protein